ncbi:hypothetical protein ACFLTD_02810 [Elusimicrobiota bacterium]
MARALPEARILIPMNIKIVHQYFELNENTRKNTIESDTRTSPLKRYILFSGLKMKINKNENPAKVIKRGHKLLACSHEEKVQDNASKLKRIR